MAKYSFEIKRMAVSSYLNNEGSYSEICKKYNIASDTSLRKWIRAYSQYGEDAFLRSRNTKKYTYDFKLHVVELYLTTEISYQDLALEVGVNNPPMISKWVNDYRIAGPDALKPKRKGRLPLMYKTDKSDKSKSSKKATDSADSEYLKQLEEENLKLRIENAYLKELRRLRLEEKPPKKKRE